MNDGTHSGSRATIYWITTIVVALLFAVPGVGLIAHAPHFAQDMGRLGYPSYFLGLLGVFKVLGAAAILAPGLPRVKEWAYAGMMVDVIGAIVSRAVVGDEVLKMVVPVVIGGVLIASWALRPASRTLTSSSSAPSDSPGSHAMQRAR